MIELEFLHASLHARFLEPSDLMRIEQRCFNTAVAYTQQFAPHALKENILKWPPTSMAEPAHRAVTREMKKRGMVQ